MSGDDRAAPAGPPHEDGPSESLHRKWMKALALLTPWGINRRITNVEARNEARMAVVESRLDAIESAIRTLQEELSAARDERLSGVELRADAAELALSALSDETARLRDRVVPAAVARADALLDRLAEELEEIGSLVERSLRGEPLPVPAVNDALDARISGGLAEVQPLLLEAFRGSEEEIHHRLDLYLPDLRAAAPVLDLGCGRGELLLMLRDAGVEATGIDGDPALAAAAHRRGLDVVEGDVLEILRTLGDSSRGAVTAFHLFEHLPPATARRRCWPRRAEYSVLARLLIAECPNPHALRVGAALFWQDPTHQRPLLPETLEVFLRAAGFRDHPHRDPAPLPRGPVPDGRRGWYGCGDRRRPDDSCGACRPASPTTR